MNLRKKQGITLNALIITIIVMLILAGIAISTIRTEGIPFGKMKEAMNQYNEAMLNEAQAVNEIYNMLTEENHQPINVAAQVNEPVLAEGMIPIVWDESKQEWTEIASDLDWYSYEVQTGTTEQTGSGTSKWANAKMPDGSMFVWIPRYAYQITEGYHTGGEGVKGNINIVFMKNTSYTDFEGNTNYGGPNTTPTYNGTKQTNWIVHPAFRANANIGGWDRELPGIWVAKFEASNTNGYGDNIDTANDVNLTLQIVPNKVSWRKITANNMFTVCKNASYGYNNRPNTIDSHMMKNTEWGAIAYLAHSKYGRNGTEISINNSSDYYVGKSSGDNSIVEIVAEGSYNYETLHGQLASTTGNIYGVYDMSGGAWEYVTGIYTESEIISSVIDNCTSIIQTSAQYKNVYATENENQYGDAVYETATTLNLYSSWFYDYSDFVRPTLPIFGRGGYYGNGAYAGLFARSVGNGGAGHNCFRPVLVIQ